ncbi:DUF4209 domain-containing protein [Dyella tabacisoli]|nr:DUF4209 domain-containing protein [Dyella tabacisoli]
MTDTVEGAKEPVLPFASFDDFRVAELSSVLLDMMFADDEAFLEALYVAKKKAVDAVDEASARAYELLWHLCAFHLNVNDPSTPFDARWRSGEGRSYVPSDFRGSQNDTLLSILPSIEHPVLRARIADIVWYNDRKHWKAAGIAVSAYCDVVSKKLDGTFQDRYESTSDSFFGSLKYLHRAFQITAQLGKREKIPDDLEGAYSNLYARIKDKSAFVAFADIARLGVSYGMIEWVSVAADARQMAEGAPSGTFPLALQKVWDLAAEAYTRIGDREAKHHCQLASVELTLSMRDQVSTSSARAAWTMTAIGQLRAAGGFSERIKELRRELRDLQEQSVDEFGQFSIPVDLEDEQVGTIKVFSELTLPEALLNVATFARSLPIEQLRSIALNSRSESLLSSSFGASYSDRDGKVVAQTPASPLQGEPSDDWLKAQWLRTYDLWRHQIVGGHIEPARRTIMQRFPVEERFFEPIVAASPFVPFGHEHIFALGFARFWQGDFASSVHLLIPQLENSIRHVLQAASEDSSKIKTDLLQEDRSLSGLLDNRRPEMDRVFGEDLVNEIDLLFNYKAGPALRHQTAHGKMYAGACYSTDAIYACWLVYKLTCIPLLGDLRSKIAIAIEELVF